jgi:membrane-bound lytic murein transglycosylase MltF
MRMHFIRRALVTVCVLALTVMACTGGTEPGPAHDDASPLPAEAAQPEPTREEALLERYAEAFTGDLPEIRERRSLRVLVSYSKTNFFFDDGSMRGFEYELMRKYEKFLNADVRGLYRRTKVVFVPTPFDELLDALVAGRGDVAAAGLTVTPVRAARVAFTHPYIPEVREVLVLNDSAGDVQDLDDLSGRSVYVVAGSSYATHLFRLNREFASTGRPPIDVVEVDPDLATEDVLELVSAGVTGISVADQHIADAWAEVLDGVVVRGDIEIHAGGSIAWAVRKDNPKLLESLNAFVRKSRRGSLLGNVLFERYYEKSAWIGNPLDAENRGKLERLAGLFRKYGEEYGFDWLALAAQAYQESGLDQNKKSRAGAVGIMQIRPSTARDKHVDIHDIHNLESNIHAGTKYLDFLRSRYFDDSEIPGDAQIDFAWAAYNAGPAAINKARRRAAKERLDPNLWFGNVERIVARTVSSETVDYVSNVNKYYVAYKLQYAANQRRANQLSEALKGGD